MPALSEERRAELREELRAALAKLPPPSDEQVAEMNRLLLATRLRTAPAAATTEAVR